MGGDLSGGRARMSILICFGSYELSASYNSTHPIALFSCNACDAIAQASYEESSNEPRRRANLAQPRGDPLQHPRLLRARSSIRV